MSLFLLRVEHRCSLLGRRLRWTPGARKKHFQTDASRIRSEPNDASEAKNSFVKFEDMLTNRRRQAAQSIIVQVQSELSCSELYNFCQTISPVISMFHYNFEKNHFVLVEFTEDVVNTVLPKCSHGPLNTSGEIRVPVTSPVVWFKATAKNKKFEPAESTSPPLRQAETPIAWPELVELISAAPSVSDGMKILFETTKLGELGTRLRFLTARQLELPFTGLFPHCAAIPFGSSVNSFGRHGCDVDLVFQHYFLLPHCKDKYIFDSRFIYQCKINSGGSRVHTQRQMEVLADVIQVYLPGCTGVKRILQARVPIVKYTNGITGLDCDVSMSNLTGVYMSEVLYLLASVEPDLSRELVFTVKQWAFSVGLTNPSPGRWITNFTLTLLCLFYMQVHSIIPSLDRLRKCATKDDSRTTEDIDCTFCRDLSQFSWKKKIKMDSASLLRGFFEYYTNFDFSTLAISLSTGNPFSKPDYSPIYVANPLEKGLNVAKNMSSEEVERLRMAMRNAYWNLETSNSLLTIIGTKSQEQIFEKLIRNDTKFIPNRMVTIKDLFAER
ncbi:poly(A) RNA polymerase, mitochondrial-like [Cimex lectularius]|uniref:Poly(A) RNA polymerase, mitochondrial n=1 Tax=Cimex lectularius TaxID=79782 RepID=A0A8I6S6V5_CIMLE|nr:poly(A) RNA polymerase, mitochondrial-like [Cimex lectularius]